MQLPRELSKVKVPPIKCQGIKTKLVRFILKSVVWDGKGKWIEPFLGSGVVLFNLGPKRALVADNNPHIISFYRGIQTKDITAFTVRPFLEREGKLLLSKGEEYYYEVRDRFNSSHDPLDLLFLNRSCFNGVMRFNMKGKFNVPFCRKPNRFRKPYITKIVNQVKWVSDAMLGKDWQFMCADWRQTLELCDHDDFVYLDPPYFGRHTGYTNCWSEQEMKSLIHAIRSLPSGYALSLWKRNIYRSNPLIERYFSDQTIRVYTHDYFVGSKINLRHKMEEALIIRPNYEAPRPTQTQLQNYPTYSDYKDAYI